MNIQKKHTIIETFIYPSLHWLFEFVFGSFFVILLIMVLARWDHYSRLHGNAIILISVIGALLVIALFYFFTYIKLRLPIRYIVENNGLQLKNRWRSDTFIKWNEIQKTYLVQPRFLGPALRKSLKIELKDGRTFLIWGHLKQFDRFREIIAAKIGT